MALFAISDLHLSLDGRKPMDKFGAVWENYVEKLYKNWTDIVREEDCVIIAGDVSWATYLDECFHDFNFLNQLPGIKLILKGNHDYWWTSITKLNNYVADNNFKNIFFIHNNFYLHENIAICGTRGWTAPNAQNPDSEDSKIYTRELGRLNISLGQAAAQNPAEIVTAFHFPPLVKGWEIFRSDKNRCVVQPDILKILKQYDVKTCVYAHSHAHINARKNIFNGQHEGIMFHFTSCDFLNFYPIKIK